MSLSDWELFLLLLGIESWVQVSKQLIDQEEALSSLLLQGQEAWVWGRQSGASCWPSALLALLSFGLSVFRGGEVAAPTVYTAP